MRLVLTTLGWLFALAALFRSGLVVFTAYLAASRDTVPWGVSVESIVTEHATFLSWVPDLGRALFPSHFIDGILENPALVMISLGAVGAAALAYLCFRFAKQ